MDPAVSTKYSPTKDIWNSRRGSKYSNLHQFSKLRPSSFSEFSRDVMSSEMSDITISSGNDLKFRSRLNTVPVENTSGQRQAGSERMHLDVVDDAFTGGAATPNGTQPPSLVPLASTSFNCCALSPFPSSTQQMLSTELKPPIQRPTTSVGWLEVSIDSTLPSSPAAGKNVFDLSHLDNELPEWKPVKKHTQSMNASVPTPGCSLMKRLLPEASTNSKMYSRKVFIGGLPPDIDQNEIRQSFEQYGALSVDWPHKVHSKSNVPPKGYAFLLFKEEKSVHQLLTNCFIEGEKLFTYVKYTTSGALTKKKVQTRPWRVSDSFFMAESNLPGDSRKAIFVGGVPRPIKASELAEIMSEKFGPVTFIAIDCDSDLKYPKGAACVIFATHTSYIAAVSSRFMQLVFGTMEKKVELKPYILDDQLCDECNGIQSNGQPAPFFCGSVTCLRYYCEHCWATFHSLPGRHNHRPLFKDVFDREKFC